MRSHYITLLTFLTTFCLYGQSQPPTIVLTSKDVYTNSVRVITSPTDTVHGLGFYYLDKSSADIEAIAHRHPRAQIMKDGVVVAETVKGGSAGVTHDRTNYVGLVLHFTNYDDAKLAEKALRGN